MSTNATTPLTPQLEEYSDNTTFSTSDHRLLALWVKIKTNSMRTKITLPNMKKRIKEIEDLLETYNNAVEFFENLSTSKERSYH